MNLFNPDFEKHSSEIIDAFVSVYGEAYRGLITERLNLTMIITYINNEGLASYIKELESHPSYKGEDLTEYKQFLEKEEIRISKLIEQKTKELIAEIKRILPDNIRKIFETYEANNELKIDLGVKSKFEYFSSDDEEILNDLNASESLKRLIYSVRLATLSNLGIKIEEVSYGNSEIVYKKLIEKEEVKKLIPPSHLVSLITEIRERKYHELEKKKILESETYLDKLEFFTSSYAKQILYDIIKSVSICNKFLISKDGTHFTGIFFTIRKNTLGINDFIYLHELIHRIETTFKNLEYISGFEIIKVDNKTKPNPYDDRYRKYERMNEAFADIFALETRRVLHSKRIYFIEDASLIKDAQNSNTSAILKEIVIPLLKRVRPEIIETRMTGNLEVLWNKIGYENYEALNDIVNKVDYLIREKDLIEKLNKDDQNDETVVEFREEMSKLEQIYLNIDEELAKNKRKI